MRNDKKTTGARRPGRCLYLLCALCAILVVGVATVAQGGVLDLTAGGGGFIGDAYFLAGEIPGASGTGVWDSFVRMNREPPETRYVEEGYNTSGRELRYQEYTDPNFTRDLQLFEVPIVNFADPNTPGAPEVSYYEFLLDINEPDSNRGRYISLDAVKLFRSGDPIDPVGDPPLMPTVGELVADADHELRYETDAASAVKLDFELVLSGSGRGDMTMLVPIDVLGSKADHGDDYITLYSHFGALIDPPKNWTAADGFEEWAVRLGVLDDQTIPVIPEPVTMAMCGFAIAGVTGYARKRIRNKKA